MILQHLGLDGSTEGKVNRRAGGAGGLSPSSDSWHSTGMRQTNTVLLRASVCAHERERERGRERDMGLSLVER